MRRGPPALGLFNEVKQTMPQKRALNNNEVFVCNVEVLFVVCKGWPAAPFAGAWPGASAAPALSARTSPGARGTKLTRENSPGSSWFKREKEYVVKRAATLCYY